jgi:hypothetical protein
MRDTLDKKTAEYAIDALIDMSSLNHSTPQHKLDFINNLNYEPKTLGEAKVLLHTIKKIASLGEK